MELGNFISLFSVAITICQGGYVFQLDHSIGDVRERKVACHDRKPDNLGARLVLFIELIFPGISSL